MLTGADLADNYKYWDNRENVTYFSHATAGDVQYALTAPDGLGAARRRAVRTNETIASGGRYTKSDRVWLIPKAVLPAGLIASDLKASDRIQDADGDTWTVLESEKITWNTIWKLTCRNLVLVNGLKDSVDIFRPTNDLDAAANRIPGYESVYAAIPGVLQEVEGQRQEEFGKVGFVKKYVAALGQRVTVTTEDRVIVSNVIYQVTGYRNPDRIDLLMELDLERLP